MALVQASGLLRQIFPTVQIRGFTVVRRPPPVLRAVGVTTVSIKVELVFAPARPQALVLPMVRRVLVVGGAQPRVPQGWLVRARHQMPVFAPRLVPRVRQMAWAQIQVPLPQRMSVPIDRIVRLLSRRRRLVRIGGKLSMLATPRVARG